jgi:macrolide transport system ATP-binding/permease protein
MRLLDMIRLRLRSLFSRATVDRELDAELQYHLDRQVEANVAAGMARDEARAAALRALSGVEQAKEACRDARGWNLVDHLRGDLKFALRQLRQSPAFTAAAVFVLALGTCAGAAIFAFVDAALIKPLPYREPNRLVGVYEALQTCPLCNLSYPDFLDWKARNEVFSAFDAYQRSGYVLATPSGPEPVRGARVTAGFFRTLGVAPSLGRDFSIDASDPKTALTLILGYSTWQRRYGGRSDVLGQVVQLDGKPVTVIGVLPRDFHFAPAGRPEYWVSLQPSSECDKRRSCHGMYGVARLAGDVPIERALSNVTGIARQLEREYPDSNRGQGAAIAPLADRIVGDIRPMLLVLLGGAGLLLVIAAVNVAALLLVRSESRRREIAVRAALGASWGRLVAQFVTEAVLLVGVAVAVGLAAAHWTTRLLQGLISETLMANMPFLAEVGLTGRVVAAACLVGGVVALLLSVPPAWRLRSAELRAGLAEASRGSAGRVWRRLGSRLVVAELTSAMVLLTGAGLLAKSLHRLLQVETGVNVERLVTIDVETPEASYGTDARRVAIARDIEDRVRALPGVQSAGLASLGIPLGGNGNTTWLRIVGRPWNGEHNDTPFREIGTTYFQTLGARLQRGRYFDVRDDATKPLVVIVNKAFARHHFPGEEAVGRQLIGLRPDSKPMEIVGIVDDIREGGLDEAIPPVLYMPFAQSPENGFSLVARTSSDEQALLPEIRAAIRAADASVVPIGGTTMAERVSESSAVYLLRTLASLVGCFAGLALLLGVVGVYGVIAYSVGQRSREIGIRLALGAQRPSIYRLILGEAGALAVAGVGLGIVGSAATVGLIRRVLFSVSPWDATVIAGMAALLGLAALLASFVPARRAATLNPVETLRAE